MSTPSPFSDSPFSRQAREYDWYPLYSRLLGTTDTTALASIADALEAEIFERSQNINRTTSYIEFQEMRLAIEVLRIVREEKLNYPKLELSVKKPPARAGTD